MKHSVHPSRRHSPGTGPLAAVFFLCAGLAQADAFLNENFNNGVSGALGTNTTSDGNGSWQETRDGNPNGTGAEGSYQITGQPFQNGDTPFSGVQDVNMLGMQQSSGRDSTLNFTQLAAGETLYFSMNINMLDDGSDGGHQITFFNEATTPFMSLAIEDAGTSVFDLVLKAQNNIQTRSGVIAEDTAYFLYGKLETSADLKTWTLSASITDNVNTIPETESWQLSQTNVYPTAKSSHANRLSFDTSSGAGRMLVDEIRLGAAYTNVVSVTVQPEDPNPADEPAPGFIAEDPRWEYPHFLGFRPANGCEPAVNPPRFSWHYPPGIVGFHNPALKKFTLQIDDDSGFGSPAVNQVVDYNFFNSLAPFATNTWYWRVGYDNDANGSVDEWSRTNHFTVTTNTPTWDRSSTTNALSVLSAMSRPRLGPAGGDWAAFKTWLEDTNYPRRQIWLTQLTSAANTIVAQNWYSSTNYFPPTDEDGSDGDADKSFNGVVTFSTPGGDVTWGSNEFGAYCQDAMMVAFAHKITGDSAYAGAKDVLLRFANFPHNSNNRCLSWTEGNGGTTKQSTCITEYLALLYDWYYSDLSTAEQQTVRDVTSLRVKQVYNVYLSWRSDTAAYYYGVGIRGQSHPYQNFMWALPGLLIMAGEDSTVDATMETENTLAMALDFLTGVTASSQYGPDDGAINEGLGYGGEKMGTMLRTALASEMMLNLEQQKNPFFAGYQKWYSHVMPSGYDRVPFGDQWEYDLSETQLHNQRALTLLTGSAKAKKRWDAEISEQADLLETSTFSRPWTILLAEQHFATNSAVVAATESKTAFFADSGWAFAGSTPPTLKSQVDNSVRMSFHSRPRGGQSHSYRSENAFAWYGYGEPLLAGGGSRRYPDAYSRHTMSHNAMLIDGNGQEWINEADPSELYMGRLLYAESGSTNGMTYTHWVGDASKAYRTLPGLGLKRWHRHVILVDESYFILYDDLVMNDATDAVTFSQMMHVDKDVTVTVGANDFTWSQNGVNARVFYARNGTDLTIEKQTGHEVVYSNLLTGVDMLPAVEQEFINRGRNYWSEYVSSERSYNQLWINNAEPRSQWQLMTALLAWPDGQAAPSVSRLDDRRMQISFDGQTRTISFDPGQPGDYTVNLNDFRTHAGEIISSNTMVSVSRSADFLSEKNAGSGWFYIIRSGNYDEEVTVHYTLGGAAAEGLDYTATGTDPVVIPAQEGLASIQISVLDDSLSETNETVVLTLETNIAFAIDQQTSEMTIRGSDLVSVGDAGLSFDVQQPINTTQQFAVTLHNPFDSALTFQVPDGLSIGASSLVATDSTQPGGPTYVWNDIKSSGTRITAIDGWSDAIAGGRPIGFGFPHYGETLSNISISVNGFLGTGYDSLPSNTTLPSGSAPSHIIAGLWDDWVNDGNGIYTYNPDANTFVVQYDHMRRNYTTDGFATFQIHLKSSGEILLYCKELENAGFGYTVGTQNAAQDEGLLFGFNQDVIQTNMAVRFGPSSLWLSSAETDNQVTVPAGSTLDTLYTIDTADVTGGTLHTNTVDISSSDPVADDEQMEVRLNVNDPTSGSIEEWRWQHFGTTIPTGDAINSKDIEPDGLPNFAEFAVGADPNVADPEKSKLNKMTAESGYFIFTHPRREGTGSGSAATGYTVEGITYTLRVTTNLTDAAGWTNGPSVLEETGTESNGDGTETITVRLLPGLSSGPDFRAVQLRIQEEE